MAALRSLEQWNIPHPSRRVLQRWQINGVVVIAFAIILAGVGMTLAAEIPWAGTAGNPFDPYETILPGMSVSVLEGHDCPAAYSVPEAGYTSEITYCHIRPESGPIRLIAVNASSEIIRTVSFRSTDVRAGDLIEQWGHPDTLYIYRTSFVMLWDEGIFATGTPQGRFSYWSPVRYVLRMEAT